MSLARWEVKIINQDDSIPHMWEFTTWGTLPILLGALAMLTPGQTGTPVTHYPRLRVILGSIAHVKYAFRMPSFCKSVQKLLWRGLKIILDGTHQGDRDILDMVELSSSTVIVSHSNSRAVYNHPRNLPDDVIKAVAQKGGFVGVNGWPPFVSADQFPTFDQFFAHLDHIVQLVGPDHAAIGMDYFQLIQGVVPDEEVNKIYGQMIASGTWTVEEYAKPPYVFPKGIETPAKLANLTGELLKRGYSKADIAKIWGGNWLRVMSEVWGG